MICFNCGCNLPDEEKQVCRLCGMKMPNTCQICHAPNPEFAVCCLSCGAKMPDAGSIKAAAQDVLLESRRNVAVMFADVSGFTALSEKLDPEEVRTLINDCFQTITRPVYELEGTIDKYIGDCVMVLFGARYAHSDDPVRAVDCAQSMLSLIQAFSEERLSARGLSLTLSIGINYGLVVTGSVGNYYDKDYTVMGDVVNTAQRLQTAAASGTVLVSESIREEARDAYDFVDFGTIAVKNRREPVHCYNPSLRKQQITYEQLLLERSTHMTRLKQQLEQKKERGLVITGDPGTGKSALAKAFSMGLDEKWKVVWTDGSSTYRHRAYHVVSSALHGIMNISPDESSQSKRSRLMSFGYYLFGDNAHERVEKMVNFLGLLMGMDKTRDFHAIMSAMRHEDIERELVGQTADFFIAVSRRQPFLLILDGYQWADNGSSALMTELLPRLSNKSVFVLFVTRQVKAEWSLLTERIPTLTLEPLGHDASVALTMRIMGANKLEAEFESKLSHMTHGNPMLIVEWVTALRRKERIMLKDGVVCFNPDKNLELPTTMESLVLSTLSDFSPDTLAFAQMAAVMGSEFRLSWLSDMQQNTVAAEHMLSECIEIGLMTTRTITARADRIEKICGFRHDATRESIVGSLLHKNRIEMHLRFANYLERKNDNNSETILLLLSEHYEAASMREKSDTYLHKLAVMHQENFNYEAALSAYNRLIERDGENATLKRQALIDCSALYILMSRYDESLTMCMQALALLPPPEDRHILHLMLAEVYMEMARYGDALEKLDEMELRVKHDAQLTGRLMKLKCTILRQQSNPRALTYARHAVAQLRKTQDLLNLSEVLSQTAYMHFARGSVAQALKELNQAYDIAERANNLGAMARLSGNLGIIHHASGSVSKALTFLTKAIELAGKVSNLHSQTSSRINLGILYMEKGQFNSALEQLGKARELAEELGMPFHTCLALLNTGDLQMECGAPGAAETAWKSALQLAEAHELPCEAALAKLGLTRIEIDILPEDMLLERFDELRERFAELDEPASVSDVEQFRARYYLQKISMSPIHLKHAKTACLQAEKEAEKSENRLCQLRAHRLTGILYAHEGDLAAAVQRIEETISAAHALESDYEAAKGEYLLAQIFAQSGNANEVAIHIKNASVCISEIDDCFWKRVIASAIESPQLVEKEMMTC